jgi:hypothetical protein
MPQIAEPLVNVFQPLLYPALDFVTGRSAPILRAKE